jgi:hypothetical protein
MKHPQEATEGETAFSLASNVIIPRTPPAILPFLNTDLTWMKSVGNIWMLFSEKEAVEKAKMVSVIEKEP